MDGKLVTTTKAGEIKVLQTFPPGAHSRRRESFAILLHPPSPCGRCFNTDGEGVSVKSQSSRRPGADDRLSVLDILHAAGVSLDDALPG